jgi:hypothetical protein
VANSAEILMTFGLQQSKENAAPVSTPEKYRAALEKAASSVGRLGKSIKSGVKAAWGWITGSSGAEPVARQPAATWASCLPCRLSRA